MEFILARLHKIEAESIEAAERLEGEVSATFHTVAATDVSGLLSKLTGEHANIAAAANPPAPVEEAPPTEAAPA